MIFPARMNKFGEKQNIFTSSPYHFQSRPNIRKYNQLGKQESAGLGGGMGVRQKSEKFINPNKDSPFEKLRNFLFVCSVVRAMDRTVHKGIKAQEFGVQQRINEM